MTPATPFKLSRDFSSEPSHANKSVELQNSDDLATLSSEKWVILDFYADWCGPCKRLTPLLDAKVKSHGTPVTLVKINVDRFKELAASAQVSSIPHVYLLKDGKPVTQFKGLLSFTEIDKFFAQIV